MKALAHAARRVFSKGSGNVDQKGTETSLIERFLYPKLGPGQMWRIAAEEVRARGGEVRLGETVINLRLEGGRVVAVETRSGDGQTHVYEADAVISTMPVQDLVKAVEPPPPAAVREVAEG